MTQGFIYDDGGRVAAGYKGDAGDCVCRSIAIATEQPYQQVYDALNALGSAERQSKRRRGKSSARTGVHKATIRRYMESIGWAWVPTMQVGAGCKVHLRADELPQGRIIVSVSRHMTAMIDGVIRDTHDPRRDDMWWCDHTGDWETRELRPGQTRNVNGIWTKSGGRCVYGYYKLL